MRARNWLSIGLALASMAGVACDKETKEATPETASAVDEAATEEASDLSGSKEGKGLARALHSKESLRLRIQREPETLLETAVERRLYAERVEASSFLWVNFNRFQENYHPNYIMDGDPTTAWVEGADGNGLGEWVRVRTSAISEATQLRVRIQNGYHKTGKLFKQNARVKELELRSLASGKTQSFSLADNMDWQELSLPLDKEKFEGFELKVVSDYAGTKYKDLCVSDLEVFVTGRTPENPKFETNKLIELQDWKKSRLAAAQIFSSKAGKELPIKSAYRVTKGVAVDPSKPVLENLKQATSADAEIFARAEAALQSKFKDWRAYRLVVKNPVKIPEVDGLVTGAGDEPSWHWPDDVLVLPSVKGKSLLQAQRISLFESKNSDFEAEEGDRCEPGSVHALRPPDREGPTAKQLLVWRCLAEEERDGVYHYYAWELLEYDDKGWLRLSVNSMQAQYLDWQEEDTGQVLRGGQRAQAGGEAVALLSSVEEEPKP